MKTLLKRLYQVFIFSLILSSIECQVTNGNDSTTPDFSTDTLSSNDTSSTLNDTNTSIVTTSNDSLTNPTIDANNINDTNTTDGQPITGGRVTSGVGDYIPQNDTFGPLDEITLFITSDGPVTSRPYSDWVPLILLIMVFSCCAILGTIWALMKTSAIKKADPDKRSAREEKQISDTDHKDDKPDGAPAVKSGESPPPAPPSDTPRSSTVEPSKPGVELSVKDDKSVKLKSSSSEKMSQTSAKSSVTGPERSRSNIGGQSDMKSTISNTPSHQSKSDQLKTPSKDSSQTTPPPDSATNSSAQSGTDASKTKSKESV